MSRDHFGGHDLDDLRRLTGADAFAGRRSLRDFRFDPVLSEAVRPLDGRALVEAAAPMTDDEVIAELQKRLAGLLGNADLTIFKSKFLVHDVMVDVYALPPGSSELDRANAKHKVRFVLSSWKDGVPVKLRGSGAADPTGGKVVLAQVWNRDVPKLTKRTTTVAKAIDTIAAWCKDNAATFSPKGGWAMTARGAEPNLEADEFRWQDAFPSAEPLDDFGSWAQARDAKDGTQPGVMGEAAPAYAPVDTDALVTKPARDRLADPIHALARTAMLDADAATAAALTGLAQAIQANDPKAARKSYDALSKAARASLPADVLTQLGERRTRRQELEHLASGGDVPRGRRADRPAAPVTGSPKAAVEDLQRLLKSLRG